ncbi:MAG: hypothetical protein K9J12_04795 [Melioribacteraceae bacterium]|nr:hypothetical protein [Melioribacteraceae bacterium]MCF8264499.1 hypothetical protein [Melioribacteraceae bacterium]MCF8411914.1 hypothetical protein [Melioribacteraceae bacterium]
MNKLFCLLFFLFTISVSALTPEEIKEAYHRSYTYEKIEDYENAIRAIMPVYDEYSSAYTVNLRLGWLYYLLGKYSNSLDHYQKAMKANQYSLEAKNSSILPLLAQNKYSEAETMAYQIVSVDYYNYYGNLRLSYVLRMQKKNELASQVVNKMLAVYPSDVSFLTELAYLKHAQNDKETAASLFWDILILDPENNDAKSYLQVDE